MRKLSATVICAWILWAATDGKAVPTAGYETAAECWRLANMLNTAAASVKIEGVTLTCLPYTVRP